MVAEIIRVDGSGLSCSIPQFAIHNFKRIQADRLMRYSEILRAMVLR